MADHVAAGTPGLADAHRVGQAQRAQDAGDGVVDVRAGDQAALHAVVRLMAQPV